MKFHSHTKRLLALTFIVLPVVSALAQNGMFESVEVYKFAAPYKELVILYYGTEVPVTINEKTKFKGAENRTISPDKLTEGDLIRKLTYELTGETYLALEVEANVFSDGNMEINGLFEGFRDGLAIIDGYPVRLAPGVTLEGSKRKNKCQCKGLLVPNFNSPIVQPGDFYITVEGKMDEQGVINAKSAELCRNTFGETERQLLAAVSGNLQDETSRLANIPAELASLNMNLYNGEIKVGQYSYQLTDDIELQGYVNKVGHRVLPRRLREKQVEQGPVYYRFYVINDPIPNAFAFPNGMIFVHTGLLEVIENEAQLAAVLGHEIAHVTHEHGRERYETTNLLNKAKTFVNPFIGEELSQKLQELAPDLSPSMVNTIGEVSQAITPAAISNVVKPQPEMEAQADRVGLYYAYEAGYDIREAARFWEKMASLTGDQRFQSKIVNDLMGALQSSRLSIENGNIKAELSTIGGQVLAKQLLDTIYTSHPKARNRSRAINRLVGSVYNDADWQGLRKKEKEYRKALGL